MSEANKCVKWEEPVPERCTQCQWEGECVRWSGNNTRFPTRGMTDLMKCWCLRVCSGAGVSKERGRADEREEQSKECCQAARRERGGDGRCKCGVEAR